MISRIIWFFCGNILFRNRRIEYEGEPVSYEEESEQEPKIYEPVKTFENYFPGKQIPLDHVEPMFMKCDLFVKVACYVLEIDNLWVD